MPALKSTVLVTHSDFEQNTDNKNNFLPYILLAELSLPLQISYREDDGGKKCKEFIRRKIADISLTKQKGMISVM